MCWKSILKKLYFASKIDIDGLLRSVIQLLINISGFNEILEIEELDEIGYTIDKTTITTNEIAHITGLPNIVKAVIDSQIIEITDNKIDYSNNNLGNHDILIYSEGYKLTKITILVVVE